MQVCEVHLSQFSNFQAPEALKGFPVDTGTMVLTKQSTFLSDGRLQILVADLKSISPGHKTNGKTTEQELCQDVYSYLTKRNVNTEGLGKSSIVHVCTKFYFPSLPEVTFSLC